MGLTIFHTLFPTLFSTSKLNMRLFEKISLNIVMNLNNIMMIQAILIKEVYTKSSSKFQGLNRKIQPCSQCSLCFHVVATSNDSF
jgi:hypothetical protein